MKIWWTIMRLCSRMRNPLCLYWHCGLPCIIIDFRGMPIFIKEDYFLKRPWSKWLGGSGKWRTELNVAVIAILFKTGVLILTMLEFSLCYVYGVGYFCIGVVFFGGVLDLLYICFYWNELLICPKKPNHSFFK